MMQSMIKQRNESIRFMKKAGGANRRVGAGRSV